MLGGIFGREICKRGGQNDIWSAENIESTAQSVANHAEQILANFYDNIFARGAKQIKYGQHLSTYFAQKRSDRKARAWRIWARKIAWQIRRIVIAPLKWIRALWRKIAWRFLRK